MFDAIVAGVRVYNTQAWIIDHQSKLMQYVEQGGTFIVQYNTTRGLITKNIGPYSFTISRDRVTNEKATVIFIDPKHRLLTQPNKMSASDFTGWVQERGLYFASKWDQPFESLFSMHDPGDDPVQGSLLLAHYGKGTFIYTGLSFFRQIPAGVPGAFKLLANMISYRQKK